MKTVVIVLGPTAAGKTKAAVEIARVIDGEIISADSMQIYRGMDIGTAKPKKDMMQGITHHLIDEIEPYEPYSVSLFQKACFKIMRQMEKNGKAPVISGGTGLYINSITYDLDFSKTDPNTAYRDELKNIIKEKGLAALYEMLMEKSKEDAERINPNDEKRIIRRLEILNRKKESGGYDFQKEREGYDFKMIGLNMPRAELYEKINARVDEMVKEGLLDEVKKLYKKYGGDIQSMQGIGYKEMIACIKGECDLNEAIENIKKATRNFAKRQITWFSRDNRIKWFNTTYYTCLKELIDDIIIYIKNNL